MLNRDMSLEPRMRGLRIALRLAFVVVIIMAVVGFAVVKESLLTMNDSINDISAGAQTRNLLAGIRKSSTNLLLMAHGFISNENEAEERRNIFYMVQNMSAVQSQVYINRRKVDSELTELYTSPRIPMEELVGSTVSARLENYWYALTSVMSTADQLRQLNLSQIAHPHRPEFFVRAGGLLKLCINADHNSYIVPVANVQLLDFNTKPRSGVWDTILDLNRIILKIASNAVTTVRRTQTVILTVALVVLTAVVVCLLPPAVLRVERRKDECLDLFLTIPVQRVQQISAARLDQLTQMGLEADAASKHRLLLNINGA